MKWSNKLKLSDLSDLSYNFDLNYLNSESPGWYHDRYCERIDISKIASTATAPIIIKRIKEYLKNYKFPDPKLVRSYFDPNSNMEGRNMLIEGKFLWVKVYFPVRISEVIDTRDSFGYSYRTLEGHWEKGQISFFINAINKYAVEIKIESVSQPAHIERWDYRIGFKLFGRYLQRKFAKSCIKRIKSRINSIAKH